MRLTQEVTEDLLKEVAGEDTIKLVGLLKGKDNVSEFKLAEKLRLTVNTVRNMLYRLQEHNLVTSTRKKDKKKGWYIYYWTFNTSQARILSRTVKQNKLEKLKAILETEAQETFYICPDRCTRFKMDNAMDYDFKCPECGVILQEEDNAAFIEKIRSTITGLEEDLAKPMVEVRRRRTKKAKRKTRFTKRGRPKLKKRGRPRKVKRVVKKIAKRPKAKLKRKRVKLAKKLKVRKIKMAMRKPKRVSKVKKVKKAKPKKKKPVKKSKKKPKTKKQKAKPKKKKSVKKKAKPKKRSVIKRMRRLLKGK